MKTLISCLSAAALPRQVRSRLRACRMRGLAAGYRGCPSWRLMPANSSCMGRTGSTKFHNGREFPKVAGPPVDTLRVNTPPPASDSEKFDFRRQKTLERAYLRSIELLLESYCKPAASTLTGSLRQNCKVDLRETVQNPWESLVHPENYSPVVFSLPPLPSRGVMIMPVPMALLMVELKLGGNGHRIPSRSSLTEIEAVLLKDLTNELLARLAVAFSHATELRADWQAVEQSRQILQRLPGIEMYLHATFDVAIGDIAESFQLSFAFPFTMLIPLLESFSVRSEGAGVADSRDFRESVRARLLEVPVSIEARFKSTSLSYGEVMAIEPGAVLSLGHRKSEPIELRVGGVVLHKARPTRIGKRVAAMIVKE